MDRISRANAFERGITRSANSERAGVYFQRDPRTGKFRGIVEHVAEDGAITFLPQKPVISKDMNKIKNYLATLVNVPLNDKGVGEPWHAESNMPFDLNGNKVS